MTQPAGNHFGIGVGSWANPQDQVQRASPRVYAQLSIATPGAGDEAAFLSVTAEALFGRAAFPSAISTPPVSFSWLEDVYSLVVREQVDEAVDLLFDRIDDLLVDAKFDQCDAVLRAVDLKRLDTNLIVAVLSITLTAGSQLPYRARLLARAEQRLRELVPDRVDRLMIGLR